MRVLFITHKAELTGAPISLLILMEYLKRHYDWDTRILVRKTGPTLRRHQELAPTELFLLDPTSSTWGERIATAAESLSTGAFKQAAKVLLRGDDENRRNQRQRQHYKDLKALYQGWKPDLVYSNTAMNGDCIHMLELDAPVITHVRELGHTLRQLQGMRLESFLQRTDLWVAVSEAVRDHLITAYAIPEDRIEIIPPAIESDRVLARSTEMTEDAVRAELGIGPATRIVGGVGFVGERKGADIFVEIAAQYGRDTDAADTVFVWIGEGPHRKELMKRVADLGLERRILFIGQRENPYPYIRALDALLMTSRDDPFPRANIEAGFFARPAIAFRESGGSREFCDGDCGLLVPGFKPEPMVEALRGLLADDALRRRLGENAREKVKARFDVESVGRQVADCILRGVRDLPQRRRETVVSTDDSHRFAFRPLSAQPLVSVILSSYNYGQFVGEAVRSVFAQDYRPLELIIVDDGSTDTSRAAIEEACADAPIPARIIHQENSGQAGAWNTAFAHVTGELVCFLDSDDYWLAGKVESMVRFAQALPDAGLYQHQLGNGAGRLKRDLVVSGDIYLKWKELGNVNVGEHSDLVAVFEPSTALMARKEVLDRVFPVPEQLITCPDAYITRSCCLFGPLYSYPGVLGVWREHDENAGKTGRFGFAKFWVPVVMPAINASFARHGVPVRFVFRKGIKRLISLR